MHYSKNDGRWHNTGTYNRSPTRTFYAKNDKEAKEIALGYIAVVKRPKETIELCSLVKLNLKSKKIKLENKYTKTINDENSIDFDSSPDLKNILTKNLEKKLSSTEFFDLEKMLLGEDLN